MSLKYCSNDLERTFDICETQGMSDWKNIVNLNELGLTPGPGIDPYRGDYNRPATEMNATKLGFNVHTISPGNFSCPYHFHHEEEELFLILEGRAMLRQSNQYREVTQGDLIFFRVGPEGAHQFYNHTSSPCKVLAISTRDAREVVEYPDSKKIYVSQIKKLFSSDSEVDYWKDENNPKSFWPAEHVR